MQESLNHIGQTPALGLGDVQALLKDPAPEARVSVVAKLAGDLASGTLQGKEWAIALDILRLMAADAETRVRRAVSESLKDSEILPHDVALKLARDDFEVAQPILARSLVLTEDDLIAVLEEGVGAKQTAIATRPFVPDTVCEALVETGNASAVAILMSNSGALISESVFTKTIERYQDFETVKRGMALRPQLPATIAERLVSLVSDKLKLELIARHQISNEAATDALIAARERATAGLAGENAHDLIPLIRQLKDKGRLTASLILRALCLGDVAFLEEAMAQLAGVTRPKAAMLIHDAGAMGFKALYKKSGLSPVLYPAFRVAIDVFHETDYDGGPDDQRRFQRRLVERILTQYQELQAADLDFLFAKLSRSDCVLPPEYVRRTPKH